jgi:hypothetical protein
MSSRSEIAQPAEFTAADLRVYLLGPPEAEWAGRPLAIPRRQARVLLYPWQPDCDLSPASNFASSSSRIRQHRPPTGTARLSTSRAASAGPSTPSTAARRPESAVPAGK